MDLISLADFNAVAAHGGFGPAGRALDRMRSINDVYPLTL